VVLYKDITAQVAIATLDLAGDSNVHSIGEVSYKMAGDVQGYFLNTPKGFQRFASVFVATLQVTMDSSDS